MYCTIDNVEWFVGSKRSVHERDKLVFRKTIPVTHIEYKEGNCSKENHFFLHWAGSWTSIWLVMRNTFSVEGVFLAESQYAWWCGHVTCLGAIDVSASTYRYCLYLWTKYYGKIPCLSAPWITKSVEKRKRKYFSFSVFSPIRWNTGCTSVTLPTTQKLPKYRDVCGCGFQAGDSVIVKYWVRVLYIDPLGQKLPKYRAP